MKKSLRIISVSSEVAPYLKTGGLGDVCHSLSKHLSTMGHQVTVAMPFYWFMKKNPELQNIETIYHNKEGVVINNKSYPFKIKRKQENNNWEFLFVSNDE